MHVHVTHVLYVYIMAAKNNRQSNNDFESLNNNNYRLCIILLFPFTVLIIL